MKFQKEVFLPASDDSQNNVQGLLIGPRGSTLRKLQKRTNTHIQIRGQGSQRARREANGPQPGDNKPLHAFIQADSERDLERAERVILKLVSDPKLTVQFRQQQIKALEKYNGTDNGGEEMRCMHCGSTMHTSEACPLPHAEPEDDIITALLEDKEPVDILAGLGEQGGAESSDKEQVMTEFYKSIGVAQPDDDTLQLLKGMGYGSKEDSKGAEGGEGGKEEELYEEQEEEEEDDVLQAEDVFLDNWGSNGIERLAETLLRIKSADSQPFTF